MVDQRIDLSFAFPYKRVQASHSARRRTRSARRFWADRGRSPGASASPFERSKAQQKEKLSITLSFLFRADMELENCLAGESVGVVVAPRHSPHLPATPTVRAFSGLCV